MPAPAARKRLGAVRLEIDGEDEGLAVGEVAVEGPGFHPRAEDARTTRSESNDTAYADLLYTEKESDRQILEALSKIATDRGVSRAQIALAWLRRNPVVVAPLVGAGKPSHIEDAVASLRIELTDDEVAALERPYTPRHDWQGISDPAELARIAARFGVGPR
jgi:hypothetical protein